MWQENAGYLEGFIAKNETSTQDSLPDLWSDFDLLLKSGLESKDPIPSIKLI